MDDTNSLYLPTGLEMLEWETVLLESWFSHRVEPQGLKEPYNSKENHDNQQRNLKKHDWIVLVNKSCRDFDDSRCKLNPIPEAKSDNSND